VTAAQEQRTGPNQCTVVHDRGSEEMHFSRENVEKLLAGDSFFWIDIDQPGGEDFTILRDVFKFHPLAVEDAEHFDQRAKIDEYDDFVFLVVFGANPDDDRLVEVHCFYSEKFLVTVHRDEAPAFSEVRKRYVKLGKPVDDPGRLLYEIVGGLVDSFFPILADFDDRIDELVTASHQRIVAAPALLLACLTWDGLDRYPDETRRRAEHGMALLSLGAAVENLMLAAAADGYASCWVAAPIFCPEAARDALALADDWLPHALVLVGRPDPGYVGRERPPIPLDELRVHR